MNKQNHQCSHDPNLCKTCTVRHSALFGQVAPAQLNTAVKWRHHQHHLKAKTILYMKNSKAEYAYTLNRGWLMLYQTTNQGKRQILRFALPGDLVGLKTNDEGKIMHSAMAITDASLCAFKLSTVKELIATRDYITNQYFSMEAKDMELYHQYMTGIGQKPARGSIAFLLAELFHRCQAQDKKSYHAGTNSIYFPLTQEDIGDALGLTNVHVNRVINEFRKQKLIECIDKRLFIHDMDGLCDIAEYHAAA